MTATGRLVGYGLRVDACVCGRMKTAGTPRCRLCSNRRKGALGVAAQAQQRQAYVATLSAVLSLRAQQRGAALPETAP